MSDRYDNMGCTTSNDFICSLPCVLTDESLGATNGDAAMCTRG
jgi:hypothetical protein